MKKLLAVALSGLLAAGALPAVAADMGSVDDTIRLAMLEWSGAQISSKVAGQVLEKAGYKVEYVTAGNYPHFTGLADGTLSASVEIWLNNVGEVFPKALASGQIEDIGTLGLETREGWLYPKFMEEVCPGLPDWTALEAPGCVAALATPDTLPDGRFLDYPADWGSRAATILADNDLPYVAVPSGSEGALVAELKASVAKKTPLLMMFWAPHSVLAEVDAAWVAMPPCKEETEAHCITPPDVDKVVWSGFEEKWPAAFEILKEFRMNTEDQQAMMLRMDNGESLDAVTADWIAGNEAVWKPWVEAATGG